MEKTTRNKLIASGVLIVASVALLLGLTFAWFTDSVTNKGNKIQAGTLGITATKADVGSGIGPFAVPGLNDANSVEFSSASTDIEAGAPIISEASWEPGQSNAKLLTVTNSGNLAAKVKLRFDVSDGGLQDALWFDFVQVKGSAVVGQFEKRPMSMLSELADQQEFHLAGGDSISFILAYGMSEAAGNEFQNKTFEATVSVIATQDAVETDGFGSKDYDAAAEYPTVVTTADQLVAAAATGGTIELGADVALADSTTFAADTTLNLNGKTLTVGGGAQSISAAPGTTLVVEGDGAIEGAVNAENRFQKGSDVIINAGENFSIVSKSDQGRAVYGGLNSNVTINGGTYTATKIGNVIQSLGSSLSMSNATVNILPETMIHSIGILSNASRNTLVNVTVNAAYSKAVDFNKDGGVSTIQGGTFVTDRTTDNAPAATISYQGVLNITDAKITHIGVGIMYTLPKATGVDGLTESGCTFNSLGSAPKIDYKH